MTNDKFRDKFKFWGIRDHDSVWKAICHPTACVFHIACYKTPFCCSFLPKITQIFFITSWIWIRFYISYNFPNFNFFLYLTRLQRGITVFYSCHTLSTGNFKMPIRFSHTDSEQASLIVFKGVLSCFLRFSSLLNMMTVRRVLNSQRISIKLIHSDWRQFH